MIKFITITIIINVIIVICKFSYHSIILLKFELLNCLTISHILILKKWKRKKFCLWNKQSLICIYTFIFVLSNYCTTRVWIPFNDSCQMSYGQILWWSVFPFFFFCSPDQFRLFYFFYWKEENVLRAQL